MSIIDISRKLYQENSVETVETNLDESVIESGLLSTKIFLTKVAPKIGQDKYLLLILCWKLIQGCKDLKTGNNRGLWWRIDLNFIVVYWRVACWKQ